jgi:large subunit ribosomal protein L23
MVTLRRPPKYQRSGPVLDPYQVVVRPLITEKATHLANPRERRDEQRRAIERRAAYTFEVNPLATKTEIKHAIELLFHVKVHEVRTQNRRGKSRRYRLKLGRTRSWKKAIVTLHHEHRIDYF